MVHSDVINIDFVPCYAWASGANSKRCFKIGDTNTPNVDLNQPAITLDPLLFP